MSETAPPARGFDVQLAELRQLALDLRCTWHHATDELWSKLEPELWARTRNPWVVMQSVSRRRLAEAFADEGYCARLAELARENRESAAQGAWFQQHYGTEELSGVAYFSMEFMLSEALPIYSGGLGNVAGDQLKAASDLGVPVVGVGLLYSEGYFRQVIDEAGNQQALYPYNDPGQLPVRPLRGRDGEWLRLELPMPGHRLWVRAWKARVGRRRLYLLDCNDIGNPPARRGITSELYGGDAELRLQQEMVLGIGGWRLLEALGFTPEVCHLNEGHAAFAVLDRARSFMERTGLAFDAALAATRAGNVFTTHTAVPAGFDRFAPRLIDRYLGHYARDRLRLSLEELLALGRQDPRDDAEPFNMAYLALRGSGAINAVSRLHGEVSRRIFQPLFPRWPTPEVPVGHVTNGIHTPSWDGTEADALWTEACGKSRWMGTLEDLSGQIRRVADTTLWQARSSARQSLIEYVRRRYADQRAASGASPSMVHDTARLFDPHALTLGFARRFTAYKRPTLLLANPERFARILRDERRPVQLVIAGKAHPADEEGQQFIRDWMAFMHREDVQQRVVFLSDYDMKLTEQLVQGVDVWINTPRRPWEACGTSGMKVLVNGGLNLSELDGWWAEAYTPAVGWALGDGREHDSDLAWDAHEADELYELLERQVIPEFYARDAAGLPRAWIARVRESMATLTGEYSANRALRDYVQRFYLEAAASYRRRAADHGALAQRIADWRRVLDGAWPSVRFGAASVRAAADGLHVEVEVQFGELDPALARVELYADPRDGRAFVKPMARVRASANAPNAAIFHALAPADRAAGEYTPRVVAAGAEAHAPLEAPHILWQR